MQFRRAFQIRGALKVPYKWVGWFNIFVSVLFVNHQWASQLSNTTIEKFDKFDCPCSIQKLFNNTKWINSEAGIYNVTRPRKHLILTKNAWKRSVEWKMKLEIDPISLMGCTWEPVLCKSQGIPDSCMQLFELLHKQRGHEKGWQ